MTLLPQHQALIEASAISPEVALSRGYRSVTDKKKLAGIMPPSQRLAPGLLIPLWNVYGEQVAYQLRPDEPRVVDGRVCKYETPRGLKMMLDCPPSTLECVRDPNVRLFIVEGVRKADSLASVGLRALGLLGVDCWRGTNEKGGKTIVEDWFGVALDGREIVICFDSDAFRKPEVHRATEAFGRWVESRGAEIAFVYLPHAADGSKQGVDDFLHEHSRDELLDRIETVWHPLPHQTISTAGPAPDVPLCSTAELLTEVRGVLARFVILPSNHARLAVVLFVLHTWAFDAAHSTPYLVVRSATKRSGKTRLEEVLEQVVRAPWRIVATSESALFRKITAERPTLLLDEVDALFGARSEGTEPIRAILNAGNRPGAAVARVVGEGAGMQSVDFSVYCPKVLGGIVTARWPDTVLDRAIVIPMQRKKPDESVQRLRIRKLEAETEPLRARLERWAHEHVEALREADPELPAGLDDRAAEAWEAPFAIADLAEHQSGENWGDRARTAALALSTGRVEEDEHGVVALRAIRTIFGERDAVHTTTIIEALNEAEDLPFGEYRKGEGLNSRSLAGLLKPFPIGSQNVRLGGRQAKGYRREQFLDAWTRYCENTPANDPNPSQRPKPNNDEGLERDGSDSEDPSENTSVPPESPVVTGDGTPGRIEAPDPAENTNGVGRPRHGRARPRPPAGPDLPARRNGAGPATKRTVADLSDEEVLAIFPGSTIELGPQSDIAPCGCRHRAREWRLRGEGVDVTFTRASSRAALDEADAAGRGVLQTGKCSGWTYDTTPTGRGHPWVCGLCHPPVAGLDVEMRDLAPVPPPAVVPAGVRS